MKYYLGLDAGGSKTYTLIADENGTIVGKGHSGNGNHQVNYELAKRNIRASVEMALAEAGLTPDRIEYAYFGLAGADREPDYVILRPLLAELGFPRHDLNCDTMIALRAGTNRPYGVVLICGSGTNSAGRNKQGEFLQCGGFTYLFGDFGGGGTLSVEVFRSVIRAWDGREEPTLLTELLLKELGFSSVQEMFDDYLDNGKSPPLRTAKLAFEAAEKGDSVAQRILRTQGAELGKSAKAVIRRLRMEQDTFDVVLAGSIVTRGQGDFVHAEIRKAVSEVAPGATVVKLTSEPVIGALWMAFEAGGEPLPAPVYEKLKGISDVSALLV